MEGLRAYRAGAGTGKTTKVCDEIVESLTRPEEPVDPSAVLATTFTRSAAAELKSRIQREILADDELSRPDRVRLAEQIEFAAIGTVHAVARELLERYALQLGLSPRLQVIDEDAANRHLDEAIAHMPPEPWEKLASLGERLELTDPRDLVRSLVDEKRTNQIGDDEFRDYMGRSGDRLCEIVAPDGPNENGPAPEVLPALADEALAAIEKIEDETKRTADAVRDLEDLTHVDSPTWKDIVEAGKITAGKQSGANDCLEDLRELSRCVRQMPELHEDIREYTAALAEQALAVERAYQDYKRERGLLDFTDLEVLFVKVLEDEKVREDLSASFTLVLVDEFQDSNPIQLEIFLRLHEIVGNSCWVGDPKQSIYGFRDADLDLAEAAWRLVDEENIEPLSISYRAQQGLVDLQNRMFTPVFGADAELDAVREAEPEGIERWFLDVTNNGDENRALADGVRALIREGWSPGQIAILTRTNPGARARANELEGAGIPAVVERSGLLENRECSLVQAGLALVVDPYDALAAAEVLHLLRNPSEDTPRWLLDRLHRQVKSHDDTDGPPWADREPLIALRNLDARTLSPSDAVGAVIRSLDLPAKLPGWGRPARRAANLDEMVTLARQYEDQMREEGRGASVHGLLGWFDELYEEDEDDHPQPHGVEAVTVSTYHGAKGLEWPVVVLSSLEKTYDPDLWEPHTVGGQADEGHPLEGRRLRCWIWPFGTTWNPFTGTSRMSGSGLEDDVLRSPEGQRQAERKRQEENRLLYVGMTRARDKLVLTHRGSPEDGPDNTDWLSRLPHRDVLDPELPEGEHEIDALRTTVRVRHLEPTEEPSEVEGNTAWGIHEPDHEDGERPLRARRPHEISDIGIEADGEAEALPGEAPFPDGWEPEDRAVFGKALHAYLAGLPSLTEAADDHKTAVAARCVERPDGAQLCEPRWLVDAGERFRTWANERFRDVRWYAEVPVTAPREEGGVWMGTIDLLLVDDVGEAAIIDHKAASVRRERWVGQALEYKAQLWAYDRCVQAQGLSVTSTWIHLPVSGAAIRVDLPSEIRS